MLGDLLFQVRERDPDERVVRVLARQSPREPQGRVPALLALERLDQPERGAERIGREHRRGVLVDRDPHALGAWRLVDWGLAHAVGPVHRVAGTPGYIAPEMMRRRDAGPWSDLYSLGATLWHVVCGGPPEDAPFEPRVAVPAGLRAWFEELLAPHVADRFARAVDVRDALHALGPATTRPAPGPRRTGVRPTLSLDDPLDGPAEAAPAVPPRSREIPAEWPDPPEPPHLPPLLGLGIVGLRTPVFVGRRADRAVLWGALRDAAHHGRPVEVRLEGPSGSGRWRLATELAYRVEEEGVARAVVAEDGDVDPDVARGGAVVVVVRRPAPALVDALDGPVLLVSVGEPVARVGPRTRVHVLEPLDVETCSALVDQLVSLDVRARQALCRTPRAPGDLVGLVRALAADGAFVLGPHGVTLADGTSLDRSAVAPAIPAGDRRWLGLAAFLAPRVTEARWQTALRRLGLERPPSAEAALRAGWVQAHRDGVGVAPAQARTLIAALEPGELGEVARVAAGVLEEDGRWTEAGFALAQAGDVDAAVAAYERARGRASERLFQEESEAIGARIVELLRSHGRAADAAVEETWTAWNLGNLDRPRAARIAEDVLARARREGWELAEGAAVHCLAVLARERTRRRDLFLEAERIYLRVGRRDWYEWARLLRLTTVDLLEADAVLRTWAPATISPRQVTVQLALVLAGSERFAEARALLASVGDARALRPGPIAMAWFAAGDPERARSYAVAALAEVPTHRTLNAYVLLVVIAGADVLLGHLDGAADALRRSARVARLLADDVPQLAMAVEAAYHARTGDGPGFDRSVDAFVSTPVPLFPVAAHGAVRLLEVADRSWRAADDAARADRAGEVARSTRAEVRAHLGLERQ